MRLQYMTALLLVGPFAIAAGGQGLAAQDTTQAQKKDSASQQYPQSNDNMNMRSDTGQVSDQELVLRIHHTNQMEIRAAKLAQSHGASAKVKSLAARLIKDHTANDTKVVALAKQLNITLPTYGRDGYGRDGYGKSGMDSTYSSYPRSDTTQGRYGQQSDTSHRYGERYDSTQGQYGQGRYQGQDSTHNDMAAMRQLQTLRGAAFDTAFANAMVNGHNKAISMLETAQNQVQAQQLRTFIASTLPTLRQHLQLAQALTTSATTTSSR